MLKEGRRLYASSCLIVYHPNDSSRIGLVASKKVCENSVYRNKFKRYSREFFRLNLLNKNYKFVFIATKHPKDISFAKFSSDIKHACASAGILESL